MEELLECKSFTEYAIIHTCGANVVRRVKKPSSRWNNISMELEMKLFAYIWLINDLNSPNNSFKTCSDSEALHHINTTFLKKCGLKANTEDRYATS